MPNNAELQARWPHGDALLTQLAERSPTVYMAFSCGKDSIAAWLELRRFGGFRKIIPYYMFLVPGLRFVEDSLARFEDVFQTPIRRVPHPALYRMLQHLVFQPPERCALIERCGFREPTYDAVLDGLTADLEYTTRPHAANGVRCCDSIYRRLAIARHGPLRALTCNVIWDWDKRRTMESIRAAGIALPVDYDAGMFGRSFDGIDWRFLEPIKRRFPADYRRILELFPLADLEMFRRTLTEPQNGKDKNTAAA